MSHYKHLTLAEREKLLFFVGKGLRQHRTIRRTQLACANVRQIAQKFLAIRQDSLHFFVQFDEIFGGTICARELCGVALKLSKIASLLERSRSTIYREVKRNSDKRKGYLPIHAQKQYIKRRKKCKPHKRLENHVLYEFVKTCFLDRQWSPEQIAGRLAAEDSPYQISYATIFGKRGKACLVTLVDRKSRYLHCTKVAGCKSELVAPAIISLMQGVPCKTIIPDNGKEFARFRDISKGLDGVPLYFAHPSHPCERGTNENTNGLLREYFPKKKDITDISDEYVQYVVDKLNNRPRKILAYKTPAEIMLS